jgi:O-antigen ligase
MLPLVLVPLAWWVLCGAGRWIIVFLGAVLLLPPLPLPWGDAGPHPAVVVAALGLWAGLVRLRTWEFRRHPVSGALCFLWCALLLSVPLAALYSGPVLAFESLARIGLFSISIYLFLYLTDGPGRDVSAALLVRLLFWAGCASAAFACLDFYYQFPAPSRFAQQFVWLPVGVFRRAQGVFYEASTLALLCVFLLVMIASMAVLRIGSRFRISPVWLFAGGIILVSALMLSFSRTAMVTLAVSLAVMVWIERRRLGITRKLMRLSAMLFACTAGGGAILYWLLPEFLTAYLQRLWYSGLYLFEAPNLILSRRLESWSFLLNFLRENPWHAIFGIGYKTLPYSEFLGRPVVADNMYLSLLIETGVVGLTALLVLHGVVLRFTYRIGTAPQREGGSGLRRMFGLWMFCFWLGLALQMLSGDILTYWRLLPAFFAVLAVAAREPDDEDLVP